MAGSSSEGRASRTPSVGTKISDEEYARLEASAATAIATESAQDLAELAAEYRELHRPANPTERFLVDTLIHNEWRLRRLRRVEADLWLTAATQHRATNPDPAASPSLGDAFADSAAVFERLERIVNSCERNRCRALKELQAAQAQSKLTPQPEESTTTSASSGLFRNSPETHANPSPPEPAARPSFDEIADAVDAAEIKFRETGKWPRNMAELLQKT
jgi:hypothetical protein